MVTFAPGSPTKCTVAVIGAGPAGLRAAELLAGAGCGVTIYDRMPSPARKFLMAGRGGLNLTHSEPLAAFLTRYGEISHGLRHAIEAFPPAALIAWADSLSAETFTGSSGRVFPKSLKASPLLRAWLRRLEGLGVDLRRNHDWQGWDETGRLVFKTAQDVCVNVAPDATVIAVGGASWPRLGSDGRFAEILQQRGVAVSPLEPANAGVCVPWSAVFRDRFAGHALKRVAVTIEGVAVRGEAIVTRTGLEGGAIYAHGRVIRKRLASGAAASLAIDLRPGMTADELAARLSAPRRKQSAATFLRKSVALPPVAISLLRETHGSKLPEAPAGLAALIKNVMLPVAGFAGLDRAISTAGGVRFDAIDDRFMLRAIPGVFAAGEMLDWEAPTGGYLLQATFATATEAAQGCLSWLAERSRLEIGL